MEIVNLLNPYQSNNNINYNHRDPIFTYQSQLSTKNNNLNMNIKNLTHSNLRNSILSDSTSGIQILSSLSCNREMIMNNNNFNNNNFNNNSDDVTFEPLNNDLENDIINDNKFKDLIKMELSSDCSFSSGCESESSDYHRLTTRTSSKKDKVPKTPSEGNGIKKPRKSYEVSKKLEILDEKTKHGMTFVVEKYHISRSIISRWLSNIEKYRSFNKKNLKKLHKGPKASFSMEQEQVIIDKINDCRARGDVVNGETIKQFALELSKQLNNFSFKASSGWLENFKNRHNLQLK